MYLHLNICLLLSVFREEGTKHGMIHCTLYITLPILHLCGFKLKMRLNNGVISASLYLIRSLSFGDQTCLLFCHSSSDVPRQTYFTPMPIRCQVRVESCSIAHACQAGLSHITHDASCLAQGGGRVSLEPLSLDGRYLWVIAVTCDVTGAPWIEEIPCSQCRNVLHI